MGFLPKGILLWEESRFWRNPFSGGIPFLEESRFRRNPILGGIPFLEGFRGRDPGWEEFLGRYPGGRSFLGGIPLGRRSKATYDNNFRGCALFFLFCLISYAFILIFFVHYLNSFCNQFLCN